MQIYRVCRSATIRLDEGLWQNGCMRPKHGHTVEAHTIYVMGDRPA